MSKTSRFAVIGIILSFFTVFFIVRSYVYGCNNLLAISQPESGYGIYEGCSFLGLPMPESCDGPIVTPWPPPLEIRCNWHSVMCLSRYEDVQSHAECYSSSGNDGGLSSCGYSCEEVGVYFVKYFEDGGCTVIGCKAPEEDLDQRRTRTDYASFPCAM